MAICSMTGFGRGEASRDGIKVEAELSSVNRRQFDVRINLPRNMLSLESRVHGLVHASVTRGAVTGVVKIGAGGGGTDVSLDLTLAESYVAALRSAAAQLGLPDDLRASSLTCLPGLVRECSPADSAEKVWPLLKKALDEALGALVGMRQREGAALATDLARRFEQLERVLQRIRDLAPQVPNRHRRVLLRRLKDAGLSLGPEDPGVVREVALFADRCDVAEELVRLGSHFQQAARLMSARDAAGRPLDFLCQEMFREINTIGSKANDGPVTRQVIRFKTGLERIREQVQNIE